jgi:enterochelin esterase family protein
MEYQLELIFNDGGSELISDPANPLTSPGPFGDKSVIEFPGYVRPAWTREDQDEIQVETVEVRSRTLRARIPVELWAPEGTTTEEPLPLLIAHDGPEYRKYSDLLVLLERATRIGEVPPMRAALIPPHDRNETYSASATYARAFAHEIMPAIMSKAPTPHGRSMRIGMGASLGALSMLHAHRRYPAMFGGLFLQSGSFFRMRYDKQESGFPRFRRISRFVGQVLTGSDWSHPVPVTLTCGVVEENLINNRAVRDALVSQGYEVAWNENRDAHNWVAWRDTFDPHLVDLLCKVWG